jgi:preprotein translocase subunit SecE
MGRIQRKKSPRSKKKKKQKSEKQAAEGIISSQTPGGKKAPGGDAASKSAKKKAASPPKRQSATAGAVATKPRDNIFTKTAQFLREVKVELKKVTWPSRKQTIGSTAVVIVLVMIISLFLGVVDFGISSLIRIVLQ